MKQAHLIIVGDEILSGRRVDGHFAHVRDTLAKRGIALASVRLVGDDLGELSAHLRESMTRTNAVVFCCGGIGATPDDMTRQAAAMAAGVPLVRHAGAVAEIEAQFGADAYPVRVRMADLPQGASLIPNPVNRVPGFSLGDHHFMPGFPQMTWPMIDWLLATRYADWQGVVTVARSIRLQGMSESQWLDYMEAFGQRFPDLKLFSLPHMGADGTRVLELGCVGEASAAQAGVQDMQAEAARRGADWQAGA